MNELQFGNKIRQALNHGLHGNSDVAERLRAARERALAHQKIGHTPGQAWAVNIFGGLGGWSGLSARVVLPLAVLVTGLVSINTWQTTQRLAEVEEIDAQLLTDELPIDAYLDRDFEAWLKQRRS